MSEWLIRIKDKVSFTGEGYKGLTLHQKEQLIKRTLNNSDHVAVTIVKAQPFELDRSAINWIKSLAKKLELNRDEVVAYALAEFESRYAPDSFPKRAPKSPHSKQAAKPKNSGRSPLADFLLSNQVHPFVESSMREKCVKPL